MGPFTYMLYNSSIFAQCVTSSFTLRIPNISPSSVSSPSNIGYTRAQLFSYLHRRWLILSSMEHATLTSHQEDFRHKDPSWIYRLLVASILH
ncbi:hypothetical protein TanjilG_23938 [Lupinus angustifolius]|uniref:Uncharacterized protein n=1 Tax=Lupinus angustifolius TaxID=3871 RepID=A0A1J7GP50_LUPAN|nr:hypothetical protein TanjilG_23938 [Lupinus angustifolius]